MKGYSIVTGYTSTMSGAYLEVEKPNTDYKGLYRDYGHAKKGDWVKYEWQGDDKQYHKIYVNGEYVGYTDKGRLIREPKKT